MKVNNMYLRKVSEAKTPAAPSKPGVVDRAVSGLKDAGRTAIKGTADFLNIGQDSAAGWLAGIPTALGFYLLSGLWDKKGENRFSRFLASLGIGAGVGLGAKGLMGAWQRRGTALANAKNDAKAAGARADATQKTLDTTNAALKKTQAQAAELAAKHKAAMESAAAEHKRQIEAASAKHKAESDAARKKHAEEMAAAAKRSQDELTAQKTRYESGAELKKSREETAAVTKERDNARTQRNLALSRGYTTQSLGDARQKRYEEKEAQKRWDAGKPAYESKVTQLKKTRDYYQGMINNLKANGVDVPSKFIKMVQAMDKKLAEAEKERGSRPTITPHEYLDLEQ